LEVLLDAFEAEGFECHVPSAGNQDDEDVPGDGYYEDIFQVRKAAFLAPFETQNDLFFGQDWLGKDIGKLERKSGVFLLPEPNGAADGHVGVEDPLLYPGEDAL